MTETTWGHVVGEGPASNEDPDEPLIVLLIEARFHVLIPAPISVPTGGPTTPYRGADFYASTFAVSLTPATLAVSGTCFSDITEGQFKAVAQSAVDLYP